MNKEPVLNRLFITSIFLTLLSLASCGGGSSGSDNDFRLSDGKADLSMNITDAPVDGALQVFITITGMTLKAQDAEAQVITLNGPDVDTDQSLTVDLLSLSGGNLANLFTETVPTGTYEWIRFELKPDSAFIVWDDETQSENPLTLPANKNELKTSGAFKVDDNGTNIYTIDWDLRKSIVDTNNGYILKPVLHLRKDSTSGYVTGNVLEPLFSSCEPEEQRMIYTYSGEVSTLGDLGSDAAPVLSVKVNEDSSFYVGPLTQGDYTLAFTCDGALDDPETIESLVFPAGGQRIISLNPGANGPVSLPSPESVPAL